MISGSQSCKCIEGSMRPSRFLSPRSICRLKERLIVFGYGQGVIPLLAVADLLALQVCAGLISHVLFWLRLW
jgi:hypothetical protein